jgi:hypothetical protein
MASAERFWQRGENHLSITYRLPCDFTDPVIK